jgi:hypothetical protein
MDTLTSPSPDSTRSGFQRRSAVWLARPARTSERIIGWIVATALFAIAAWLLGGPTEGDFALSAYSTWAVASGHLACVYPPHVALHHIASWSDPFAFTAPLYPLLSGTLLALLHTGHAIAFPQLSQFGAQCHNFVPVMYQWSMTSGLVGQTLHLGYVMWPVLCVGAVLFVRTTKFRNTFAEFGVLLLLALCSPVLMTLVEYFHPQDVLAMGLLLAALASVRSDRWLVAGILLGLAISAQQFVLLPAVALLLMAPKFAPNDRRPPSAGGYRPGRAQLRLVVGAAIAGLVIDGPMLIATSGRAWREIILGSSRAGSAGVHPLGGTLLWELHPHGIVLFIVTRVLPIVTAAAIGFWARERLGGGVLAAQNLMAIVALTLSTRLVFEINLFGYYFMALAVSLVVLDVVSGRLRGETVAWIALCTVAFNPVHWGLFSNWTRWDEQLFFAVPLGALLVGLGVVIYDAAHRRVRPYKVIWLVLVATTGWFAPESFAGPLIHTGHWFWQIVLVPTGIWLAWSALERPAKPVLPLGDERRLSPCEPRQSIISSH